MKRDEWYNSPEFKRHRLLNNLCSEIAFKVQELNDVLELVADANPHIVYTDKFNLTVAQGRVVRLETDVLSAKVSSLCATLSPAILDG